MTSLSRVLIGLTLVGAGVLPAGAQVEQPAQEGIQWRDLFSQSSEFLALEHGFRWFTDKEVRSSNLPFLRGYASSVENLHGWGDGDPFFVNYVGHPLQGAIAGFVFVQNDPKYKDVEFGRDRRYWKSRLRATAFSWAYSEAFEIGPISEASIGHTQAYYPQQGFVDHVITPTVGLGWMIAEDALDRMVIRRVERSSDNRLVRIFARGLLNPSRTMANMLAGKVPWYRGTRGLDGAIVDLPREEEGRHRYPEIPPFELITGARSELLTGAGGYCSGGGAIAEFRVRPGWEVVGDISGCKLLGMGKGVSGDSLTFLVGPRRVWRQTSRWQPYAQVLGGGRKLTLELVATQTTSVTTPEVSAAAGIDFRATSAIGIRLGEFGYAHTWRSELDGADFSDTVHVTAGLILRWGTW